MDEVIRLTKKMTTWYVHKFYFIIIYNENMPPSYIMLVCFRVKGYIEKGMEILMRGSARGSIWDLGCRIGNLMGL